MPTTVRYPRSIGPTYPCLVVDFLLSWTVVAGQAPAPTFVQMYTHLFQSRGPLAFQKDQNYPVHQEFQVKLPTHIFFAVFTAFGQKISALARKDSSVIKYLERVRDISYVNISIPINTTLQVFLVKQQTINDHRLQRQYAFLFSFPFSNSYPRISGITLE